MTIVETVCPQLAPPPSSVLDALEDAINADPAAGVWADQLDKHYEKLGTCPPSSP